jgi:hypothetical protein
VKLRLVLRRGATAGADGTVEGFYTVNNAAEVRLGTLTCPLRSSPGKGLQRLTASFAGIFATHRRASTPLTYTFDAFSAEAIPPAVPALAFSPEAMYFNVTEGRTWAPAPSP